jgi:hypothetical protein
MKTTAVVRIILYSLLFLALIGILLIGIFGGKSIFGFSPSGEITTTERSVSAAELSRLEIDWAAGTIKILTGDTDQITVKESKDSNNPYAIVIKPDDDTLKIQYAKNSIHFGNVSSKDLTIIVPKNWDFKELTIDGAALEIDISGVKVESLELDGAAAELNFNGKLRKLDCDGAATKLNLTCTNSPNQISIDGAACELKLTLPVGYGYRVETDGLAIDFNSNCAYTSKNGEYIYGNAYSHINVSGLGCKVTVDEVQ